jgi:hypothetical protein
MYNSLLHLERIQRPVLAELVPVEDDELTSYAGGDDLRLVLQDLQLACFEDMDGRFWFGSSDPNLPDHDRWVLTVDRVDLSSVFAARSWRDVYFSNVMECGTAITAGGRSTQDSIVFALQDLAQEIKEAMETLYEPDELQLLHIHEERQAKRRELYQAFNTFYYYGFIPEVLRLTWNQDMHDLVRHPETWLARHPEAAGMPHELVLRMHGLAPYVDDKRSGNDWLDSNAQLGII